MGYLHGQSHLQSNHDLVSLHIYRSLFISFFVLTLIYYDITIMKKIT